MKRLSVVISVILCFALLFGGCTAASKFEALNKALDKTNTLKSYSFKADVSGDFKITDMDEATLGMSADDLSSVLNLMAIKFSGSVINDKDAGSLSSEMDMSFNVMGMDLGFKTWQKVTEDGESESIVQNPQIPGMEDYSGKEYTVTKLNVDDSAKAYEQVFTKMLNDFVLENSKDEKFITKDDKDTYTIHVDKDKCVKLIEEIFDAALSSASENISATAGVDIAAESANVKKIIPMLIGDKGVDIKLVVGDDGYISDETITLDLKVDLAEISKAMDETATEDVKGAITVKLKIDMSLTDFNDVDEITFPEVDETNADFIEQ